MTHYQTLILEALRGRYGSELSEALTPNPETVARWIEGHMRAEHGTLDHLESAAFDRAVVAGMREAVRTDPTTNETLAESYGLFA